jgi:hypothetical protein
VTDAADFHVIGLGRTPSGAPLVLLATRGERGLAYAGNAFINLPGDQRDAFWRFAEMNVIDRPVIKGLNRKNALWLRPGSGRRSAISGARAL